MRATSWICGRRSRPIGTLPAAQFARNVARSCRAAVVLGPKALQMLFGCRMSHSHLGKLLLHPFKDNART
jgi:hypothetical protein